MKLRLKNTDYSILTPEDLNINLNIIEGSDIEANALKKAQEYYKIVKMPTIAGDSALYIEGLEDNEQPGAFVHRIDNRNLTEKEVVEHYRKIIARKKEEPIAYFKTAMAYVDSNKENTKVIIEDKFILKSTPSKNTKYDGDYWNLIMYDPKLNKYYCDLSDNVYQNRHLKSDEEWIKFIKNNMTK